VKRVRGAAVCPRARLQERGPVARNGLLGLGQFPLFLLVLESACEESLVDPTLEDRDAQFHALCDYFATVHPRLSTEFRGRQVDRHVLLPPRRF
jgi:hypothetical protein